VSDEPKHNHALASPLRASKWRQIAPLGSVESSRLWTAARRARCIMSSYWCTGLVVDLTAGRHTACWRITRRTSRANQDRRTSRLPTRPRVVSWWSMLTPTTDRLRRERKTLKPGGSSRSTVHTHPDTVYSVASLQCEGRGGIYGETLAQKVNWSILYIHLYSSNDSNQRMLAPQHSYLGSNRNPIQQRSWLNCPIPIAPQWAQTPKMH